MPARTPAEDLLPHNNTSADSNANDDDTDRALPMPATAVPTTAAAPATAASIPDKTASTSNPDPLHPTDPTSAPTSLSPSAPTTPLELSIPELPLTPTAATAAILNDGTTTPRSLAPRVFGAGCLQHTPPQRGATAVCTAARDAPPEPRAALALASASASASASSPATAAASSAAVGPFIIGVTGASASGKTTVCEKIINGLGDHRCVLVSLDWFYHGLPPGTDAAAYNFDHPDAFDYAALRDTLSQMAQRCPVNVPMYDFTKHCRDPDNSVHLDVADVIIVEGILTFYDRPTRDLMHMKLFVDEDADICLSRRIRRDVTARGRTVDSILAQYTRFVKPAFEEFIQPTKRHADIVVPRGAENLVAIDLIIKHIALKLSQKDLRKVFSNLVIMSDSYQARGLHTIIRAKDAAREDIVFYSDRLLRLLVEEGLGLLPFARKSVTTATGGPYAGVGFIAGLAAVSLLPSGATMEGSLRAVCNTVRIGKMVISADGAEVSYENLPKGLAGRYVLILNPVLNTGRSCETAIERLLRADIGCREDHILVLSLIVAPQAVVRICSRFPRARLVVSAVDQGLDKDGRVYPGIGDFATRYFGCE